MKTTVTDVTGNFAFNNVPVGPVSIWAEKPLYVAASYPASQRSLRSKPLIVAESGSIDGITIPMYRGGIIAGVYRDADITNRALSLGAGQRVADVQLVFTDRLNDLTLEVTDDQGGPSNDYVAVVFPIDAELWSDPRYLRTHVFEAGKSAERSQQLKGLLAGEYFAVATDDVAYGDLENPTFLKRLASMSRTVTLPGDGHALSLRLRRIALPSEGH